jgi:tRNA threonylcarbamoyladenosine biosynthesis protein TsaE
MTHTGTIPLADAAATEALGRALAPLLRAGDVVALFGDLGAGKTSLARGVLAALGLAEEAPSPTFAIVQPYAPPEVSLPVAHVDLYRIDDPEEAEELGLDELLEDGVLLVEWPERLGAALWAEALHLAIEPDGSGGRRLTWTAPAAWESRWPPR